MYITRGFEFTDEEQACEFFGIRYDDFHKWQRTNTKGWTSVGDYPKDSLIELTLEVKPINPYKTLGAEVVGEKDDLNTTRGHHCYNTISDLVFGLIVSLSILLLMSVAMHIDILNNGKDKLQSGLDAIVLSDVEENYDYRSVTGNQIRSAKALYSGTEVGDNIIVDNEGSIVGDSTESDNNPISGGRYISSLIRDSDEQIVGIKFSIVKK